MTKVIASFLSLIVCISILSGSVYASTSNVSATVLDQSFNGPVLVAPTNNATLNVVRPTLSWLRPTPLPVSPLNHYDLYLDDAVFASGLSDSLTSVDFYFYSATASAGTYYVTLKTDLAQGYHTWKVIAYSDAGISASSETRTFYLDSIPPFISITQVDSTTLTWNTNDPSSIPDIENRYLIASIANPLIEGSVEASSNFQIILVCPSNIPTCTNKVYSGNISSGLWQYTLDTLIGGYTYTIKASATDAAGNSTLFPDFFITYGTTITPLTSITPSASPSSFPTLPLPSTTLTPPPGLLAIVTPGPSNYTPPLSPTPPPKKEGSVSKKTLDLFYIFLLVLVILGLPLHLTMTIIGTGTPLAFIPKFLLILAFPFLRKRKYRTIPFSFITIFIADKLDHPWQTVVSDIKGFFNLKDPIPEKIFISLSTFGRTWKDNLFKGSIIPLSCLYPITERQPGAQNRLRKILYDMRIIPLVIACFTSITVFVIQPSYLVLIYAYLSLQYLFSEYLYPKL